jgi:8-hydroxy-5-deazaflavin:NADPH oxidoreductase
MSTAIIGTGNIGNTVGLELATGGERVIFGARDEKRAADAARKIGHEAVGTGIADAIAQAHNVLFAVWFDVMQELIEEHFGGLAGKVVVDPSNPVALNSEGGFDRTLPGGVSSGEIIAKLLPPSCHFVKAFGTLGADALASESRRKPKLATLFYATDDTTAAAAAEHLITVAGFEPFRVGGVEESIRIEVFGDLHQLGGLDGKVLSLDEAYALLGDAPSV